MPTAKAMSLPPRFVAGAVPAVVNDIAVLAHQASPACGARLRGRVSAEPCARIEGSRSV
jgi:hypothetical protein